MILQSDLDAWTAARIGKATASRAADIIAKTKTGPGASRANYLAELVAERLTGVAASGYVNAAMQHGLDTEPEARAAYEFMTDVTTLPAALVDHPSIKMTAATPDGFVGSDGLIEIKCPNTATHIETLLLGAMPAKYVAQMQWQMACTGRHWCDFVSFDPRMPEEMRLFVKRIHREEAVIESLAGEITGFLFEVDRTVAALEARYRRTEAA